MAIEIELNPVDFITVGTVGPKGKRVFHLQAAQENRLVSLIIEKEQAWALSEALRELADDLDERFPLHGNDLPEASSGAAESDMELREPIEPIFRVAQMGLGYDEDQNMVVLVAQELVARDSASELEDDDDVADPGIVRMWCDRGVMRKLSDHALRTVKSGRADPKQNGRLVYYWT